MTNKDIMAWAILLLTLFWMAHERDKAYQVADCQDFDRMGNGLGCEGRDIADR